MSTDRLSTVFGALADPTRRAILTRLTRGDATVAEICAPFAMSQPAISRHIKVLETAGLIQRRTEGTRSLCRLRAPVLDELTQWLDHLRQSLEASYSRLDDLLVEMNTSKKP